MAATVVVRGTGTAAARPDRAVLVFELVHTAPVAADALQRVAERTAALEAALHERGVPAADWTTTGVTVAPKYEWRANEQVLVGQRAANRLQLTTSDAALAGELLTTAVGVGARVGGPAWVVEPANPAHLEACRLAAADARRRAEAYAAGLGLALGEVVEVDETRREHVHPVAKGFAMAAAVSDEAVPIDVHAGDLDVTAEVRVTFALVPSGA